MIPREGPPAPPAAYLRASPPPAPPLEGDAKAEVAVVGVGFSGLSPARRRAERDAEAASVQPARPSPWRRRRGSAAYSLPQLGELPCEGLDGPGGHVLRP